jgi:hypothetical protein
MVRPNGGQSQLLILRWSNFYITYGIAAQWAVVQGTIEIVVILVY